MNSKAGQSTKGKKLAPKAWHAFLGSIKNVAVTMRILVVAIIVVCFVLVLNGIEVVRALDDTGAGHATASGDCVNDTGTGTQAWTSPGNAFDDDGSYASVSVDGTTSNYLKCTNFNISVPPGAIIRGIVLSLERKTSRSGTANDAAIRLVKGGTIGSTDRSTATAYTQSDAKEDHGGTSDLWGTTWTASDINASNFGAAIAVTKPSSGGQAHNVTVDVVELTVYYDVSPTYFTQEGYIFENDDGANADSNSPQLAGDTALTDARKGERLNLRTHIKNTDAAGQGDYALFYDRNDGVWTKVEPGAPITASGNCDDSGGSDAWQCTTVDATDSVGYYSSIAFDPSGNPWISHEDTTSGNLEVAKYVGSGGNCDDSGGSDAWQCTTVDATDNIGDWSDIAFDPNGNPWISYQDSTVANLEVAKYVGSGGNCDDSGGSDAWQCTTVDATDSVGLHTAIAFDPIGNPWISYKDATGDNLEVAKYVGSGGNCDDSGGSDAWQCTTVDATDSVGYYSSIAFDPSGNPWISYHDFTSANLEVAKYVGSGGNCDDSGGSDAWQCMTVDATDNIGDWSDIAFDPSGNPWISYQDITNSNLEVAKYVGSGGNCDTVGAGSDAWQCTTVDVTDVVGRITSIAFDPIGNPWISYRDDTNGNLEVARINRASEITIVPSLAADNGDVISESHADMTSVTDATNRDDADCLTSGGGWNNGVFGSILEIPKFDLLSGSTTAQCSELSFTLDTSQAVEGTTYRFVLATKDNWRADKGVWRGPIQVDEYPTLTIKADSDIRYSKTANPVFADCDAATDWGCLTVDTGPSFGTGDYNSIAIDPSGNPWISYKSSTGATSLNVAKYVGSGGNCDDSGGSDAWQCTAVDDDYYSDTFIAIDPSGNPWISHRGDLDAQSKTDLKVTQYVGSGGNCDDSGGSDAWQCTTIDATDDVGSGSSIAFDARGNPWISYLGNLASDGHGDLKIAKYVGSGGNCDDSGGSDAWQCTTVDAPGDIVNKTLIGFDARGNPWVSYADVGPFDIKIAKYVGSGGNCDDSGGSDAWQCTTIVEGFSQLGAIAFDLSGDPWISHTDTYNLNVAKYVGSGGNCDDSGGSDAWQCTIIDNSANHDPESIIAFDSSGDPWISYTDWENDRLKVARYVGSGGNCDGGGGSDAWQCTTVVNGIGNYVRGPSSIAFDASGIPWVSYYDYTNKSLMVAKLDLPPNPLGANMGGKLIPSGDLAFRVNDGRSPRSASNGNCGTSQASYAGYCGMFDNQGDYDAVIAAAGDSPMYAGAVQFDYNSQAPNLYWEGKTDVAPSTAGTAGDLILQVYHYGTTNAWEDVATDSASTDCNTSDCTLSGAPSGTPSEYYLTDGSEYWVNFRVYQVAHTTGITFKVDKFAAEITAQRLRGGRIFEGGVVKPLNTQ